MKIPHALTVLTNRLRRFVFRYCWQPESLWPNPVVVLGDEIGEHVFASGLYEREYLAVQQRFDACVGVNWAEHICLDIGANIGNHSVAYSDCFAEVVAFEPNPVTRHLLNANVLLNALGNVRVCDLALSDTQGQAVLSTSVGNLGKASLEETFDAASHQVATQTGDQFLQSLDLADRSIGFIKIDVEGHECQVLHGLSATIAHHCPVICIEYLGLQLPQQAQDAHAELTRQGYNQYFAWFREGEGLPKWQRWLRWAIAPAPLALRKINLPLAVDHTAILAVHESCRVNLEVI